MGILLGLDPGGRRARRRPGFGWCVARDSAALPLSILASGLAEDARSAVVGPLKNVPVGQSILAAGIDAPLLWPRSGKRAVDEMLRKAIKDKGAPHSAGTVQGVNSLSGACLVQGILSAIELRERLSNIPISEAHPKALLWLCPQAREVRGATEDERDALLSAFSAWALYHKPPAWCDLYAYEKGGWFSPISEPLHYFMPSPTV